MRSITEEDVVNSYWPCVVRTCQGSYKGMELEDRLMEGNIALLHAIRTYRTQYGCFEKYMLQQLDAIMKQKNKEAWAVRKLESIFSLDARFVPNDCSFALSNYMGAPLLDGTILDVDYFIEELSPIERNILIHLMEGYDILILPEKLKYSEDEIKSVIEGLRYKAVAYFLT